MVETLLGTALGRRVRGEMRGLSLHAPAHFDAEVLSVLGRLHRAGEIGQTTVAMALAQLTAAPIRRHPLADQLKGAWARRHSQRLTDALYVELADTLALELLTTDARLARSWGRARLVKNEDG
jgi:predicted nucleic acid-binding protein